jgi:hypothetical protein
MEQLKEEQKFNQSRMLLIIAGFGVLLMATK